MDRRVCWRAVSPARTVELASALAGSSLMAHSPGVPRILTQVGGDQRKNYGFRVPN
jgi:hypothetical protein